MINMGILLMLVVAAFQSTMSAVVKGVSQDITTGIQVLAYYLIPLLFLLPILYRQGRANLKTRYLTLYLCRGFFSAGAVFCFFYAAQHIQLGVAAVLFNTTPVFIPLLAHIFLAEKTSLTVYCGIAISLLGVVIIVHPGINAFISPVAFIGLLSGFLMAVSQVMLRFVAKHKEPVNRILFYLYLMCTVTACVIIAAEMLLQHNTAIITNINKADAGFIVLMLLILGFLSLVAQRTLTRAFQYLPAAKLAPLLYLSVPISSFIGWVIWQQRFTEVMAFGSVLVVVGACVITFENAISSKIFSKSMT